MNLHCKFRFLPCLSASVTLLALAGCAGVGGGSDYSSYTPSTPSTPSTPPTSSPVTYSRMPSNSVLLWYMRLPDSTGATRDISFLNFDGYNMHVWENGIDSPEQITINRIGGTADTKTNVWFRHENDGLAGIWNHKNRYQLSFQWIPALGGPTMWLYDKTNQYTVARCKMTLREDGKTVFTPVDPATGKGMSVAEGFARGYAQEASDFDYYPVTSKPAPVWTGVATTPAQDYSTYMSLVDDRINYIRITAYVKGTGNLLTNFYNLAAAGKSVDASTQLVFGKTAKYDVAEASKALVSGGEAVVKLKKMQETYSTLPSGHRYYTDGQGYAWPLR